MIMHERRIILSLLFAWLLTGCAATQRSIGPKRDTAALHDMETLKKVCRKSPNYGKRVQVFGGSLSINRESEAAKDLWRTMLGMEVESCGMGGAKFALDTVRGRVTNLGAQNGLTAHTDYNCIQSQVRWYARPDCDIYVLWCSTNDCTQGDPVGLPTDCSEADGYDESKRNTQCGGINWSVRHLRTLNPKAKIYLFDSLPYFQNPRGYSREPQPDGATLWQYVGAQRECAKRQGVKVLHQFDCPVVSDPSAGFYMPDRLHLTEVGYSHIAPLQVWFLATEESPF